MRARVEKVNVLGWNKSNMVAQYIATRPSIDLCEETVHRSGAWVARRWWYQEVLDLSGARAAAAAKNGEDESKGGEEER